MNKLILRKLLGLATAVLLPVVVTAAPVSMATVNPYTEDFADIANWTNDFAAGTGADRFASVAVNATGTIPDGVRTTVSSATFSSGGTGGVQRGSGNIVLLSTGTTDNSTAVAFDLLLDYTGVNAGTISFDWASVNNGTGNRAGSLRVYTSTDGTNFTELVGASALNFVNNVLTNGSITNVALPSSFDNSATARIRFYYHNGVGGTTGSRPKVSIDNLSITATGGSTTWSAPASVTFDDDSSTRVDADNGPFTKTVTLNFTGTTTISDPSVSAPFGLVGSIAGTYNDGQSVNLELSYSPSTNDGSVHQQTITINASAGDPASRNILLNGNTVTEVPLAQFKSEAEAGTAGGTVYKVTGYAGSSTHNPNRNQVAIQDLTDGSAATRGIMIDDFSGTGRNGGSLPDVGDQVTVYGTYTNFRGLVQFVPDRPYVIGSNTTITPRLITSADLSDETESVLLQMDNVVIDAGEYAAATDIPANDGAAFIIRSQAGTDTFESGGGPRTVLVIGEQFTSSGNANSGGDGHRTVKRFVVDLPVSLSGFSID